MTTIKWKRKEETKRKKRGGGIAIMIRKNKGWVFEEMELEGTATQEDMMIGCWKIKKGS